MRLMSAVLTALLLTGCAGASASDADTEICGQQAEDLSAARATLEDLSDGAGQIQTAKPALGDAVTALTGYVADDERIDRAVTRARQDVQAMYDDVLDQSIDQQRVATARASLDALDDTCGAVD